MKKTLIAICGLFLLAAPIQLASASANTSEVTTSYVKKCTVSTVKTTGYVWKWQNNKMVKVTKPIQKKALKCTLVPKKTETTVPQTEQKPVTTTQPTVPVKTEDTQTQAPAAEIPGIHAFEQQVLILTNEERAKQGLAALQADAKLMAAAHEKSVDMQTNNYFSHTSPTFGSPFDRLKALGISYRAAGENIAKGQRTPSEVVKAWMDSPGHRANILNAKYTHLGVGFVEKGYHWTQQFIQK